MNQQYKKALSSSNHHLPIQRDIESSSKLVLVALMWKEGARQDQIHIVIFVSLYTECAAGVFRAFIHAIRYHFSNLCWRLPSRIPILFDRRGLKSGPRSMFPTVYYMWVHLQRRKRHVKATIFEYNKYDFFKKKFPSMDYYV